MAIKPEQVFGWSVDIRDKENGVLLVEGCTITAVKTHFYEEIQQKITRLFITTPDQKVYIMYWHRSDIWSYDGEDESKLYHPYVIMSDLLFHSAG